LRENGHGHGYGGLLLLVGVGGDGDGCIDDVIHRDGARGCGCAHGCDHGFGYARDRDRRGGHAHVRGCNLHGAHGCAHVHYLAIPYPDHPIAEVTSANVYAHDHDVSSLLRHDGESHGRRPDQSY